MIVLFLNNFFCNSHIHALRSHVHAAYLRLAELAELLAQVGGVLLQAAEVELHLQAADAAHCIRGRRRHQS